MLYYIILYHIIYYIINYFYYSISYIILYIFVMYIVGVCLSILFQVRCSIIKLEENSPIISCRTVHQIDLERSPWAWLVELEGARSAS